MTQPETLSQRQIKLGNIIRLSFGFADQSGAGDYEVVRIMPTRESGERQYRIRGADGYERAIGHDQILAESHRAKPEPG